MEETFLFAEFGVQLATEFGIAGSDVIVVQQATGIVAGGIVHCLNGLFIMKYKDSGIF